MPIVLSFPLSIQEIRVLQEFRRVGTDALSRDAIAAIRHPAGGGDSPAFSLVESGYLSLDATGQQFSLTERGKEFLKRDPVPLEESGART